MARSLGTSPDMDAFWVGVTPTLVTVNMIEAAGIGSAVTFHTALFREPDARRRSEVAGFLVASLGACILLAVSVCMGAGAITSLLAPGLTEGARVIAIQIGRASCRQR